MGKDWLYVEIDASLPNHNGYLGNHMQPAHSLNAVPKFQRRACIHGRVGTDSNHELAPTLVADE